MTSERYACLFIESILARRVENADANLAVLVHVRVPHVLLKDHLRRLARKFGREDELRFVDAGLVRRILRADDHHLPLRGAARASGACAGGGESLSRSKF